LFWRGAFEIAALEMPVPTPFRRARRYRAKRAQPLDCRYQGSVEILGTQPSGTAQGRPQVVALQRGSIMKMRKGILN